MRRERACVKAGRWGSHCGYLRRGAPRALYGGFDRATRLAGVPVCLSVVCVAVGIRPARPGEGPEAPVAGSSAGPATVMARASWEQEIPGSPAKVRLRVADIMPGRVCVAVVGASGGQAVAGPAMLSTGDSLAFEEGDSLCRLVLTSAGKTPSGEAFAKFAVEWRRADPGDEERKIRLLISSVEAAKDVVFIRNGRKHGNAEAAVHIRKKWEAQRDRIRTAREFIRLVGTGSSMTGDPYQIVLPGGKKVASAEWLEERLREIESAGENRGAGAGLYQVIKPRQDAGGGRDPAPRLSEATGGRLPKKVTVDSLFGGWKNKADAERDLLAALTAEGLRVHAEPMWNLDRPLNLVGTVEYDDGSTGRIATAGWRVGFEDGRGGTWYFQWEERIPAEWRGR
ncbi:MAG: DUF5329 domain-containing protein [Planctomycetota bacterium]|nr:DUF5329 domain-containing protein [Planctomycetota bacterium]